MSKDWRNPGKIEPIRYPAINMHALKNVHGYACFSDSPRKHVYSTDPMSTKVIRSSGDDILSRYDGESPLGSKCTVCGEDPEREDHKFKLIRITDEDGRLLNEDGSPYLIKHDRPNTVGILTGINDKEKK